MIAPNSSWRLIFHQICLGSHWGFLSPLSIFVPFIRLVLRVSDVWYTQHPLLEVLNQTGSVFFFFFTGLLSYGVPSPPLVIDQWCHIIDFHVRSCFLISIRFLGVLVVLSHYVCVLFFSIIIFDGNSPGPLLESVVSEVPLVIFLLVSSFSLIQISKSPSILLLLNSLFPIFFV